MHRVCCCSYATVAGITGQYPGPRTRSPLAFAARWRRDGGPPRVALATVSRKPTRAKDCFVSPPVRHSVYFGHLVELLRGSSSLTGRVQWHQCHGCKSHFVLLTEMCTRRSNLSLSSGRSGLPLPHWGAVGWAGVNWELCPTGPWAQVGCLSLHGPVMNCPLVQGVALSLSLWDKLQQTPVTLYCRVLKMDGWFIIIFCISLLLLFLF